MSNRGRIRTGAIASGLLSMAVLAGCGGGKQFADKSRPPAPLQLNGVITKDGVSISPNKLGAGPVVISISNQTPVSHTLELDGGTNAPVTTAPIAPTDVGTIQATLEKGVYTVKAGSQKAVVKQLTPARLVIGKARRDSNDEVGLP
jgi:hypothetical protein